MTAYLKRENCMLAARNTFRDAKRYERWREGKSFQKMLAVATKFHNHSQSDLRDANTYKGLYKCLVGGD